MADDDFSELYELAADLTHVPDTANRYVKKALEVTGHSIRDDWREGAEISGGYPKTYPAAISYDIEFPGGGAIGVVIGPVLGKTPGASAGFLDEPLSAAGVDGPIHHAGRDAVRANEDDFLRGLEVAIYDGLKDELGA